MKDTMKASLLVGGITLATALSAKATEVYSTDFDVSYSASSALGGTARGVSATDWFGSNNEIGISGGVLAFTNTSKNRTRGSAVWLDTSVTGWAAGTVTVEFDVTAFTSSPTTSISFEAFAANGVDASNSVSLDLHGNAADGAKVAASGTATIASISGSTQTITTAGNNQKVTFNYNGTDQYIALVFTQVNTHGSKVFGSATLDNLTVNVGETDNLSVDDHAAPESSSTALLGIGDTTLILRRRK